MDSAKALALWGAVFCGVARAQFIPGLREPQRSGRRFVFYLGAVYVSDSNVYLDETGEEADQIVRGLAALSYESETTTRFFRFGYEFVYPYYLGNTDLTGDQHRGLLMYDQSFSWGKILVSDEFMMVSDPIDVRDLTVVPVPYRAPMSRMTNRVDPRVKLKLGAFELEGGAAWELSDYSPSDLDLLDYQDTSFHGEAIFQPKGKWQAFAHFGMGTLTYGNRSGSDYTHTRIYGGVRGEPSPKIGFELGGGMLSVKPDSGRDASDYYVSLRTTWEPTPGINRLLLSYLHDVRPSGVDEYALANKAELSYGHWLQSKVHVELGGFFESGETPVRSDLWQTVGGFAGLRYELRSHRYIFARGEYRSRDSKIPGTSYDDVRLMGGIIYRF